jgi:hypothetical protein
MNPLTVRAACMAALALAACSPGEAGGPALAGGENPDAAVFLRQNEPAQNVMDALFQGRVLRDAQGCLRLEGAQPATVIWPYGFTLENRPGGLHVRDAAGRALGRIGGSFRFGGGFVPSDDYAGLSDADRALAGSRCPGEYWIVGETD